MKTYSQSFKEGVRAKLAAVAANGLWNVSPSSREREERDADYVRGFNAANKMSDAELTCIERDA